MKLSTSREEYLKVIYILKNNKGTVRSIDIAQHMGISKPSVCIAVKQLEEQGYIKKDVLIKDILFYLNNNYREKITLEQLSKKFRASVSYICHEFTKEYRISPINYVIQRRMTEAKWSLTNTELSQAEISWRVGYENVDHFAKLFLRHVGCSPSDYRRQFKNCFAEQEILSEFPQPVSLAG